MKILITGSAGLIGSEAVAFFDSLGFSILGIDNNTRADLFGARGDTTINRQRLEATCRRYTHASMDIRDREGVISLFKHERFDLIIHAAAQPSHDLSATRPFDDFDINAVGTLNLLEATRRHCPQAVFIQVSTNKVYGDVPNRINLVERPTRFDFADPAFKDGIDESMTVDQNLHSLFGVSKTAGDLLAQEYGRNFGLCTGIFRGGCLTGPQHAGVELHGFLNYLVRAAVRREPYTVFGHKGKQVRDQIHCRDVVSAFWAFAQNPRPGEVYNLGGGKANAASLLECVSTIERITGCRPALTMSPQARVGDHICYYTNMAKFRSHYPSWQNTTSLFEIIDEIVSATGALPAKAVG